MFSEQPKKSPNILNDFIRKFVDEDFQKSPNLVALFVIETTRLLIEIVWV